VAKGWRRLSIFVGEAVRITFLRSIFPAHQAMLLGIYSKRTHSVVREHIL